MPRAIQRSRENVQCNGGPFGAVIVKDGRLVGEGFSRVTASNDHTALAEVVAIRAACTHLNDLDLSGAEICSDCKPRPMRQLLRDEAMQAFRDWQASASRVRH